MSDHEARLSTLEQARKEIEESMTIMAFLEARQSRNIKEQAQEIDKLKEHDERQRALNAETDRRIADLVVAIGKLIAQTPKFGRPLGG
jgi:hypothetical protein